MPVPFDRPLAREQFRFEPLPLELANPWTIARGTSTHKKNGLLTFEAAGVRGHGEAAPNVRYQQSFEASAAALERVLGAIAGLSPWHHHRILTRAEEAAGPATDLVASLDMALWDWRGRVLGLPVWKLLGFPEGPVAPTSFSIGIDEPAALVRKLEAASPFTILKVKLGLGDDAATLGAIRAATAKPIRADANEGWKSPAEARAKILWLSSQGVEFVEQPLPAADLEGAHALYPDSPLPLVADESSRNASSLTDLRGAFHGVNVKLAKCGGLTRAQEMCVVARNLGFRVMLGCMIESSLGIAAALQLAGFADWIDLDGNLLLARDPFHGLELAGGTWRLPRGPGLGVAPRATHEPATVARPVKRD